MWWFNISERIVWKASWRADVTGGVTFEISLLALAKGCLRKCTALLEPREGHREGPPRDHSLPLQHWLFYALHADVF